jgi:hypothetical protein
VKQHRYKEARELLDSLHSMCRLSNGSDDQKGKGAELMDIYAIRLIIAVQTRDRRVKEWFEKTKNLFICVKNPKSSSIIKEAWGKMYAEQGQWRNAYMEFYSAFAGFEDCGERESAKRNLKYLVVAHMLAKGEANPLLTCQGRVYAKEPDLVPLVQLRTAYDKRDVESFNESVEKFFRTADEFIRSHLRSTVEEFQRLAALKILKSYKRIHIHQLARKLQISTEETESVLMNLILDGALHGKIDQVQGIFEMSAHQNAVENEKFQCLSTWSHCLEANTKTMTQPLTGGSGW